MHCEVGDSQMKKRKLYRTIRRFLRSEDGPTAVEYAVLLSLILLACVASVRSVSTATRNSFDASADALGSAMTP
jgi:pilus assembly protein Flp/PilA